jgi:glycosyltransferase involved in cell wall biosynthesis
MKSKNNIIISGINLFEGGPLSILKDCLSFLNESAYIHQYDFTALVHKKNLFDEADYANIKFIEFPKSRTSYAYRLYYEYVYFKSFAKKHNVFFWLSLHDITPNVGNVNQAVYCHNPSPFNTVNFSEIFVQPTQFFFRLFYKYLYQINIKKNNYVIVQQLWIKHRFENMFNLPGNKIITAPPEIPKIADNYILKNNRVEENKNQLTKTFFFPTFPRPFKNIEVICEAVLLVLKKNIQNFKVIITINGSENKYAETIVEKYKHIDAIKFIGLIKREDVYMYYSQSDCLIFPSKLETWGLPISEFKQFNKPIFLADLPYAKETVGDYEMVSFFNPDDAVQLSELIVSALRNQLVFDKNHAIKYEKPFVSDWNELFVTLLK